MALSGEMYFSLLCRPPKVARRAYFQVKEVVLAMSIFRMYLPLALEVYNRLFIDRLGFMVVDKI